MNRLRKVIDLLIHYFIFDYMKHLTFLGIFIFLFVESSCNKEKAYCVELESGLKCANEESFVVSSGKYYFKNNTPHLWAGDEMDTHFNVKDWETLDPCYLKYGLGREYFKALTAPQFTLLENVQENYPDQEQAIIIQTQEGEKIYPLSLLFKHELINDVVDGNPVMIVFCFLADLVSVYNRNYCNNTLTFAVSGYTYRDLQISNGLESFVLWDRDTESLWWPIIDEGVTGKFKDEKMTKYDHDKWEVLRWHEIIEMYPNGKVLVANQEMEIPSQFPDNTITGCN